MASVTEDSINLAAHQVVSQYVDDSVTLNEGVRKKASELGLNSDQTSRLIERTNSEAFLKLFPETTDFEVADPKVVLASAEKVASEGSRGKTTYAEYLNRDPYDIFGITNEKTASYDQHSESERMVLLDMVYSSALEEAFRVEKTAKLLDIEAAEDKLWQLFKTAAYSDRSVGDMETELLLAFPDEPLMVVEMVNALTEKLASVSMLAPEVMKRASIEGFNPSTVVPSSELINAFRGVVESVQ